MRSCIIIIFFIILSLLLLLLMIRHHCHHCYHPWAVFVDISIVNALCAGLWRQCCPCGWKHTPMISVNRRSTPLWPPCFSLLCVMPSTMI